MLVTCDACGIKFDLEDHITVRKDEIVCKCPGENCTKEATVILWN